MLDMNFNQNIKALFCRGALSRGNISLVKEELEKKISRYKINDVFFILNCISNLKLEIKTDKDNNLFFASFCRKDELLKNNLALYVHIINKVKIDIINKSMCRRGYKILDAKDLADLLASYCIACLFDVYYSNGEFGLSSYSYETLSILEDSIITALMADDKIICDAFFDKYSCSVFDFIDCAVILYNIFATYNFLSLDVIISITKEYNANTSVMLNLISDLDENKSTKGEEGAGRFETVASRGEIFSNANDIDKMRYFIENPLCSNSINGVTFISCLNHFMIINSAILDRIKSLSSISSYYGGEVGKSSENAMKKIFMSLSSDIEVKVFSSDSSHKVAGSIPDILIGDASDPHLIGEVKFRKFDERSFHGATILIPKGISKDAMLSHIKHDIYDSSFHDCLSQIIRRYDKHPKCIYVMSFIGGGNKAEFDKIKENFTNILMTNGFGAILIACNIIRPDEVKRKQHSLLLDSAWLLANNERVRKIMRNIFSMIKEHEDFKS